MEWKRLADLVLFRAYSELRAEVARVSLGMAWWVAEPLLYMTVFYLIFGVVFQRGGPGFVYFLLTGLFVWRWFDSSLRAASVSILGNVALIRRVVVPKVLFPLVALSVSLFKFLVVFALLLLFLALVHGAPTLHWLALPLLMGVQLLFTAGVALLLAAVIPFLPDLKIVIDNLLTLWFFLSGVFFDVGEVRGVTGQLLALNPMAQVIRAYREVLLHGRWPDWPQLGGVALESLILLALAAWLYRRWGHAYAKLPI